MPDPTINPATPPAASGGLTKAEALELFKEVLSPVAATLKSLSDGHAAHSAGLKALQEASQAGSGLKAEDVAKLVTDQLTAHQKAQSDAAAKSTSKAALRDKVIAAKLPGVPKELLASLPDTEDEAALTTAADALRKSLDGLGVKLPNVGGAANDGGNPPAAKPGTEAKFTSANSGLTEGQAQFASGMTLPK